VIQAGGNTLRSEVHKLINYIWNEEEMSQQREESITVPIFKKGEKTECSNYRGISLLPTKYKISVNNLVSMLIPNAGEFIGHHQYRFQRNISTTDQIFFICQTMQKIGTTTGQYISYLWILRRPLTQLGEKYCKIFSLKLVYL